MNREQVDHFIYASYLQVADELDYDAPDSVKRNPELTRDLLVSLNHTPSVGITGSKGKGSVACMLSSILQAEEKVGLLTSPHILSFNERFKVNGISISDDDLARIASFVASKLEPVSAMISGKSYISPIGIQAAIGLTWFQECKTTFNVFEYGKGVRYDDINNIPHTFAVINSIFLEHTRELGGTLEAIAEDKSYAINPYSSACFVAEQPDAVKKVLSRRGAACKVPLLWYGQDFYAEAIRYTRSGMAFTVSVSGKKIRDIHIPLLGVHQAKNCALALAVADAVMDDLDEDCVRERLKSLYWPGRMEILSSSPLIILDACINRSSAVLALDVLDHLRIDKCVWIIGIPDDKDYEGVALTVQSRSVRTILTRSQNVHYHFTNRQAEVLLRSGIETIGTSSVSEALDTAMTYGEVVFILGTTSVVAEAEQLRRLRSL
ncbi:MAG: hypothetical protein IJQ69_06660 [Bacteroidales bacterium]|nr:hypothetical protein [Bacteroidales bacterium]